MLNILKRFKPVIKHTLTKIIVRHIFETIIYYEYRCYESNTVKRYVLYREEEPSGFYIKLEDVDYKCLIGSDSRIRYSERHYPTMKETIEIDKSIDNAIGLLDYVNRFKIQPDTKVST